MKKSDNTNFFFSVLYQTDWKQVEIYDLHWSINAYIFFRHTSIMTGRTIKNLFVLRTSMSRGISIDRYLFDIYKKII